MISVAVIISRTLGALYVVVIAALYTFVKPCVLHEYISGVSLA